VHTGKSNSAKLGYLTQYEGMSLVQACPNTYIWGLDKTNGMCPNDGQPIWPYQTKEASKVEGEISANSNVVLCDEGREQGGG
jgi:hypothetical protein